MSSLMILEYDRDVDSVSVQKHPLPGATEGEALMSWVHARLSACRGCFEPELARAEQSAVIATAYRFDSSPRSWCVTEIWPGMGVTYPSHEAAEAAWSKAARELSAEWSED